MHPVTIDKEDKMKKGEVPKKRSEFPEEEDHYGPYTKLGINDPHHGREIMFVSGKFRGRSGLYLERLDVQHRVVVYGGPQERTDVVRAVWEHTFKMKGFDGEYGVFSEVNEDYVLLGNNWRRRMGLPPREEGRAPRARPVTPDREDQLVEGIRQLMDRLEVEGPLSDRVVKKVNRRRN